MFPFDPFFDAFARELASAQAATEYQQRDVEGDLFGIGILGPEEIPEGVDVRGIDPQDLPF